MPMWLRARLLRLLFVLERRRVDEDVRLEIDAHLDLLTERYRRQGMSPDEAYVAARRQFGNPTGLRQDIHEMNSLLWLEQAVRWTCATHSGRSAAAPATLAWSIATLGLGIGGATAVFSVVESVLLAPLPYRGTGPAGSLVSTTARRSRYAGCHRGDALHVPPRSWHLVRGRRRACALLRDRPRPGGRRTRAPHSRSAGVERLLQHASCRRLASAGNSIATTRQPRAAWCSATWSGEPTSARIRRSSGPRFD